MLEFSVSKDMKKNVVDFGTREINKQEGEASPVKSTLHKKGGSTRDGSDTFMSNTIYQRILNINVEQGRVVTTLTIINN